MTAMFGFLYVCGETEWEYPSYPEMSSREAPRR